MQCPEEPRAMTLGIIPRSYEDELLPKDDEYRTWRDVVNWCRKRTRNLQHRAYADLVRHPRSPAVKGNMHAFHAALPRPSDGDIDVAKSPAPESRATDSGAPTWAIDLINAVRDLRSSTAPPPPRPHGAARPTRDVKPGGRDAKAGKTRFIFPGCWQCGLEGHQRKDCSEWKSICGADGLPPPGHKGARDKAYAKWKANANRGTKRVNNFEGEESESDGEEFDPMAFTLVAKGTNWDHAQCGVVADSEPARVNSFASLGDDAIDDDPEDIINELNRWAHVVNDAKKLTSQKARKEKLRDVKRQISSVEDLQSIPALPTDLAAVNRIARKHPRNNLLGQGEQWIFMTLGQM